jgi:hypothetical protein
MRSVQDTPLISGQAKLYIIDATQIAVKAMARHDSALAAKGRELVGNDMDLYGFQFS